jgi:Inner membrane protein YgaP-like, transmembrane domain
MKRPTINITPIERIGRVLVGLLGVIGGLVLLSSASSAGLVVLEVLLVLAGLDLMVTGALGHCPLYRKLGYVPPSLRRPA